ATTELERVYEGKSRGDLRLDLPFRSTAASRDPSNSESLHQAETLFHQALALRDGMTDAHLGLASVYMSQSKFGLANAEFQRVLDANSNDPRALIGRGVARHEQAQEANDALLRNSLLSGALEDFNAALRLSPSSAEALYNKAWVLFETGRHREALQVIDSYLSQDSDSIWAGKLRDLKSRINFTNSKNVEAEVERAAQARDAASLSKLISLAPYQAPVAIRHAVRQSLELDGLSVGPGRLSSKDLIWAGEVLEAAYGSVAGDRSFKNLLRFYAGLSPPQRRIKKSLDADFRGMMELFEKRDFTKALQQSRRFELRYKALQDLWQLHNVYHLRGNCYYYGKADFQSAVASYRQMLSVARQIGSPDLIARALGSLAAASLEQGLLDQARNHAVALKDLAGRYHLTNWQAYGNFILGGFYLDLNLLEDSRREYSEAFRLSCLLNHELVLLNSLEKLGAVLDAAGNPSDAQRFYAEAIRECDASQESGTATNNPVKLSRKLNLIYRQGDLYLRRGEFDKAESCFTESLKALTGSMRELEARNRLALTELHLRQKRFDAARAELERAVLIAASGQYPEIDWRARYLRGNILRETGEDASAFSNYETAIAMIEKFRGAVKDRDLRQSFLDRRYDPYKAIVSLLFHSLGDKGKAHEYAERSKSMTLRERLGELFPAKSTPHHPRPAVTLRTAMLDYFVGDDEVFIFFESGTRKEAVSVKIARPELEREVAEFLTSIRMHDMKSFRAGSRRIHGRLLEPVQASLDAASPDVLLILPDGPLHILPFGALENTRGKYLLEERTLVYSPSLPVYDYCLSLDRNANPARTILLLDGSANLGGARAELASLLRLYGDGARILNAKESADCGRMASQCDILHFAGHAENHNGDAGLLFRSLSGEYRIDSGIINSWTLTRTRLVNLAGCSTGIGPRSEGEAPWGLVPAFLSAGAPAVLVSLMPVDDDSTESLNSRFYDFLNRGSLSKARALQQSQLALLSSARATGDPNPSAWAPYVLIGDPR
ncbi:MAG TPA: CHAT domain-containing protein, partial [Acidobacteriota bacterium]|nr:CHAT domain-containing protein [Acidobacteriota bacterium]